MNCTKLASRLAVLFAAVTVSWTLANAQTFTVLHSFTGAGDGAAPSAGLTIAPGGSFYGTASLGGATNHGVVFHLTNRGAGWVLDPIYSFQGGNESAQPNAPVIFGPDGSLYGTTAFGGGCTVQTWGCGTVYKLRPAANATGNALGQWTETTLYNFTGTNGDGISPYLGGLTFDASGNIYGTTFNGGTSNNCSSGCGTVFELSPANGGWTENILYSFAGVGDGGFPAAGVILDSTGNLYGTASQGGEFGYGTVYQLAPSGSVWTENTLYPFSGTSDGAYPYGGVIFDQTGNLYGTASRGGSNSDGTAFELTPSSGGWNYSPMYSFNKGYGADGPTGSLVMDTAGNLYGTTLADGAYNQGSVFELTPSQTGWIYTDLHDFQGGANDGAFPYGSVALDANGNLYGTASGGGTNNAGIVWEITLAANMRHPGKLQPHWPVHYVPTLSK